MVEEVWRDIDGYEGRYMVSNLGNVKSLNYHSTGHPKNLVPKTNNSGRLWVELHKCGKSKPMLIHRLVAMAFIPNDENLPQINHKDENPRNNYVENLEWCTQKQNLMHTYQRHPEKYHSVTEENFGMRHNYYLLHPNAKKRNNSERKAVDQLEKDGTFFKRWSSVSAIKTQTGMNNWSISECCRGNRKTAYGFKWQYAT